jgi:hypothetical protein
MKWISVKDRLPVNSAHVLTWNHQYKDTEEIRIGFYEDNLWLNEEYINVDVTHWMLLPEPPKEG